MRHGIAARIQWICSGRLRAWRKPTVRAPCGLGRRARVSLARRAVASVDRRNGLSILRARIVSTGGGARGQETCFSSNFKTEPEKQRAIHPSEIVGAVAWDSLLLQKFSMVHGLWLKLNRNRGICYLEITSDISFYVTSSELQYVACRMEFR